MIARLIGRDTDTAVWYGGIGHQIIGNDGGIECFRCGMAADDGADERLIPDCAADRGGDHHWMGAPNGIECAYGDAVSTADAYPEVTQCQRA